MQFSISINGLPGCDILNCWKRAAWRLKYEIYGCIRAVERERLGGKSTGSRKILIEPQIINMISQATGKSIYSQDL